MIREKKGFIHISAMDIRFHNPLGLTVVILILIPVLFSTFTKNALPVYNHHNFSGPFQHLRRVMATMTANKTANSNRCTFNKTYINMETHMHIERSTSHTIGLGNQITKFNEILLELCTNC